MTRTVRFFSNRKDANHPNRPLLKVAHLPIRQTLIWIGPLFILIQPTRQKETTR